MERSLAIGNAIASVIAAASRGIDRVFGTIARGASAGLIASTPKSKGAHR